MSNVRGDVRISNIEEKLLRIVTGGQQIKVELPPPETRNGERKTTIIVDDGPPIG